MSSSVSVIKIKLGHHGFRQMLWARQDQGKCFYCKEQMNIEYDHKQQPKNKKFATFEHLIRKEQGGGFTDTNIVLACLGCNLKKNQEYCHDRKTRTIQAVAPSPGSEL